MHNPRGSNNRNCENNVNRNNNNRLFDSENNNKGGYACPKAWPFPCYRQLDDAARANCNEQNTAGGGETPNAADADAEGVTNSAGTVTPRMYYYEGSILPIEWTNQHGCGANPRLNCKISLQYACEDTLSDDCEGQVEVDLMNPTTDRVCGPRDGVPVNNDNGDNLNGAATEGIDDSTDDDQQADMRYGRHETLAYYRKCEHWERNMGLFTADQDINGDNAKYTRQNNNGARSGLECPEEKEYHPYWNHSPWRDIAVLVSDLSECDFIQSESQNVKSKWECQCNENDDNCENNDLPISETPCLQQGGNWIEIPAFTNPSLPPPECLEAPKTRENLLGGTVGSDDSGMSSVYNWTIPSGHVYSEYCVLRIRYNISTVDHEMVSIVGTSAQNGILSPLIDRNENNDFPQREIGAYKGFENFCTDGLDPDEGMCTHAKLGLATNTNQYGRVFEDRSYTFSIRPAPTTGDCVGKRIYNLNARGKRGNIVQAYPAVEYDFVPNYLELTDGDCVHVQWGGTDYGPDRQPNNGYGGPIDPRNNENSQRADRHNMVQTDLQGNNEAVTNLNDMQLFKITDEVKRRLVFLDQEMDNPAACKNITEIKQQFPDLNQDQRDAIHYNCGKLSGQLTPYFDAGLLLPGVPRDQPYTFFSTRDNSFTNRDMKGQIAVKSALVENGTIGFLIGGLVAGGAALLGAALIAGKIKRGRPKKNKTTNSESLVKKEQKSKAKPFSKKMNKSTGAAAGAGAGAAAAGASKAKKSKTFRVVALYDHPGDEAGELPFKKGSYITVTQTDESGWWTGKTGGKTGIFPENYTKRV